MFGRSRSWKEEHRYYLLPGMGKANRRKHRVFLFWALGFGALVSAILGFLIYFFQS